MSCTNCQKEEIESILLKFVINAPWLRFSSCCNLLVGLTILNFFYSAMGFLISWFLLILGCQKPCPNLGKYWPQGGYLCIL